MRLAVMDSRHDFGMAQQGDELRVWSADLRIGTLASTALKRADSEIGPPVLVEPPFPATRMHWDYEPPCTNLCRVRDKDSYDLG